MKNMKLASLVVVFLLLVGTPQFLFGQQAFLNNTFTASGTSISVSLAGTGVAFHRISWSTLGTVSVCAVQLDSSADNTNWNLGGVIGSQLCTTTGSVSYVGANVNYVRINVSSFTGTGSVVVTYNGSITNGGGGGGGGITNSAPNNVITKSDGTNVVSSTITDDGTTVTTTAASGVSATQFTSSVATGTAPFTVASTTPVANLSVATATNATNSSHGGTVASSTNASFFPLFVASSANGNQVFNLGTGLLFNPSTNNLSTTTFTGALAGNATSATSATSATNTTNANITDDLATNASEPITWVGGVGNQAIKTSSTKFTINPSTGLVTATGFAGPLTGLASSATALATPRAINGTNFDGSAAITVPVNNADDTTTNATMYPLWTATAGGNFAAKVSTTKFSFNPSTGLLTATGFSGPLNGNVTGNATGLSAQYIDWTSNSGGNSIANRPTLFYQTIQNAGSGVTQRGVINFTGSAVASVVDDGANNRTTVTLTAATVTPCVSTALSLQYNLSGNFGCSPITYTAASGQLAANQVADTQTLWYGKRFTDTTPTGNFFQFQNAAANADLFKVDVSGAATAVSLTTSTANGGAEFTEGTGAGLTAGAGIDTLYGDSTNHCLHSNYNNTDVGCITTASNTATLTNKTFTVPIIGSYTVAGLPAATTAGQIAVVTDASAAGSCTSGSGSAIAFCRASGSVWVPLGDGGGGGGGGTVNSGTAGHFSYYATSTNAVSSNTNLDDGATLANALTYAGTAGLNLTATGAGLFDFTEGTAPSAAASHDICYADSTAHAIKCSWNNGSFLALPQLAGDLGNTSASPQVTALHLTGTGIARNNGTVAELSGDVSTSGSNVTSIGASKVTPVMVTTGVAGIGAVSTSVVNGVAVTDTQLLQLTLPAGYLNTANQLNKIRATGTWTTGTTQTPTNNFKVKLCTISGCGSGTVITLISCTSAAATASTTETFILDATLGTVTTGATGTTISHGFCDLPVGASGNLAFAGFQDANTAASSGIDLTASLFLQLVYNPSTQSGTKNSAIGHTFSIKAED